MAQVVRKFVNRFCLTPIALGLLGLCLSGCQSFSPFGRSAESLSQSRQLTSYGLAELEHGRHHQAEELLSQAAEKNPKDGRLRSHLANALVEQGKVNEAIEQLQTATRFTNDTDIHVQLGRLYLQQGRWFQANQQADIALKSNSKSSSALVLKGETLAAKDELSEALACFQRALSFEPGKSEVQLKVAQTYLRLGQPMRSLATVEQLLTQYPEDQQPGDALMTKGIALMETKQFSSAIDALQIACADNSANIETFVRLGQAQLSSGQVSEARLTLNRAQQRFPNNPQIGQLVAELKSAPTNVASVGN